MRWLLLLLSAMPLFLAACEEEDTQPSQSASAAESPTPTTTPSPVPTQTPPIATPAPECLPVAGDVGFPVALGRIGDEACILWDELPGATGYSVLVEHGTTYPSQTPVQTVAFNVPRADRFTFPADTLPPWRGSDPCFQGEDAFFMLRVTALVDGGEQSVGGVLAGLCRNMPVLADGCVGPERKGRVSLNRTRDPEQRCITWEDRYDDETGFRIELTYSRSGEKFTYTAPTNTVEFIPPSADVDGLGEIRPPNWPRKDYGVTVWALRPGGEELVGSMSVTVM